jgi:DNA-binding transcriptional LysR family regulator
MPRPDLADLDAFLAIARAGGFRAAATGLGVSASTLSARLRSLEQRLGVRLLHRTTRSVAPTEAGARLIERLGPALGEVAAALDALNRFRDTPSGTLRINAPSGPAKLQLAPLLGGFLAAHPAIRVELVEQDGFVDIVAGGFDAGVRYGEALAEDMVAVPLGPPQRYVTAAAPALLARDGTPAHPRELLGRPLIAHRFPSGAILPWEFAQGGEELRIAPQGPLVSASAEVALRAAADGVGFVHVFDGFAAPWLASGALTEVLRPWSLGFDGPFLYMPSRRLMPSALRAFVDHLRAQRTLNPR